MDALTDKKNRWIGRAVWCLGGLSILLFLHQGSRMGPLFGQPVEGAVLSGYEWVIPDSSDRHLVFKTRSVYQDVSWDHERSWLEIFWPSLFLCSILLAAGRLGQLERGSVRWANLNAVACLSWGILAWSFLSQWEVWFPWSLSYAPSLFALIAVGIESLFWFPSGQLFETDSKGN